MANQIVGMKADRIQALETIEVVKRFLYKMMRYRTGRIEICGQSLSRTMANTLLELKHGKAPTWADRILLALQKRHLVYSDSDHGDLFMLSDLGIEVADALETRFGKRIPI